jgi:hypothetical protein
MMDEQINQKLIDQYLEGYNSFDIDGMLSALHPDVEFINFSGDETTVRASGIKEFRKLAEQTLKLFSSRKQSIAAIKTDEDNLSNKRIKSFLILPGNYF